MKPIPRNESSQHVKEIHQNCDKGFEFDDQVSHDLFITIAMTTYVLLVIKQTCSCST